jgi:hypothetical protein
MSLAFLSAKAGSAASVAWSIADAPSYLAEWPAGQIGWLTGRAPALPEPVYPILS